LIDPPDGMIDDAEIDDAEHVPTRLERAFSRLVSCGFWGVLAISYIGCLITSLLIVILGVSP